MNNTPTGFTCRISRFNFSDHIIDTINGSRLNSRVVSMFGRGGLGARVRQMSCPANAMRIALSTRKIPYCRVGRNIT